MFSVEIESWLKANQNSGYESHLKANRRSIEEQLSQLGIDIDSELAYLYINYGSFPVRGWYELNEIDQIEQATNFAHSQLGVPKNFIALTGVEGQGITLLDKTTGAVFDIEFGQFDQLASGMIPPIATSVGEFLKWCKKNESS